MKYRLRLKTAWNHVAKRTVEAKDEAELKSKLSKFWKRNYTRTTVEKELK